MKQIILSFFFCLAFLMAQGQARNKPSVSAAEAEKPLTVEQLDEGISIYPNPNYGVFTVAFSDPLSRKAELRVMNVIGNEIYHTTIVKSDARFSAVVDLNKFAKGLYYVKVESENISTVRRVVVK